MSAAQDVAQENAQGTATQQGVNWAEPTVFAYQIVETKQGVLRLSTGNGATEILVNKQWRRL